MKSLFLTLLLVSASVLAEDSAALKGQVTDATGGAVESAKVDVKGPASKASKTDSEGNFLISGLPPGRYSVVVVKKGFAPYSDTVVLKATESAALTVSLTLARVEETVTVKSEAPAMSVAPEQNAGAIILKEADLEALPDDPDEMAEALQALAGPASGPNGGQIFIDGFTGGTLPPKSAIREIRINANPFSAEYDRLGYGRIEIFTKPGTDEFRGDAQIRYNDQNLNTRDPFAPNKPIFERQEWGGSLSGPIIRKKASFFIDYEERDVKDNQIVNATVLASNLATIPFSSAVLVPAHRRHLSPRIDWQVSPSHTLSARYTFSSSDQEGAGIGGFSLPSRGYSTSHHENTLQVTETSVYGKVINETRLRYYEVSQDSGSDTLVPTLQVLDAFTAGGPGVALSSNSQKRFELQNLTSWNWGNHALKAGVRLRTVSETDIARQNFAGSVIFAGGFGPELDPFGNPILGSNGQFILEPLTSIQRYQRTLLLEQLGLSPQAIRALGGGANQLTLSGGNPEARVSQWDLAPFVQDDIRVNPDLILSIGLRYEVQDNISSGFNLAPRVGFSFSPGAKGGTPKTVIRGGFGIFYDRIGEDLTLRTRHFNGVNTLQYLVTDPQILDSLVFGTGGVSNLPSTAGLASFALPQQTWILAPGLSAPITYQSSLSVERQLPKNFTLSGTFIATQGRHELRSRNVNAPLPDGTLPFGAAAGEIYQIESTGRLNQYQWILGVNNRLSKTLTLFVRYFFAHAMSDTDGVGTFPANSYDLSGEYGRAGIDVRHRVVLGGNVTGPLGFRFAPFLVYSTGRPFNITVGRDLNGDTLFTDRPSFASDPSEKGAVSTPYGFLNPNPVPGEVVIPRNFGSGSDFFVFNLRISRTFRIGAQQGGGDTPRPPRDFPMGPRIAGDRRGEGGDKGLTLTLSAQDLLNHVNAATPVGNLSSPFFLQSLSSAGGFGFGSGGASYAGNRRIELQARYSF